MVADNNLIESMIQRDLKQWRVHRALRLKPAFIPDKAVDRKPMRGCIFKTVDHRNHTPVPDRFFNTRQSDVRKKWPGGCWNTQGVESFFQIRHKRYQVVCLSMDTDPYDPGVSGIRKDTETPGFQSKGRECAGNCRHDRLDGFHHLPGGRT